MQPAGRIRPACRDMDKLGLSKHNDIGAICPIRTGPLFGLVVLNVYRIPVPERRQVTVWPPTQCYY
jgi:hypothetical protein